MNNTVSNNAAVNLFQNASNAVNTMASNVATAANTIATNVSRNVGNLANAVTSNNGFGASNVAAEGSGLLGWLLFGLVAVGLVTAFLWYRQRHAAGGEEPPALLPGVPSPAGAARKAETWCFVGEDLTGRWCVRVPAPAACTAERTFPSRSECELVNASRLPLGIVGGAGTSMTPMASLSNA